MTLVRNITFYLVAWLCLSGFLLPFSIATGSTSPTTGTTTGNNNNNNTGNPCFPRVGCFKTYTQDDYGNAASPVNSILTQYFPVLFPNGITLGADVYLNVDNLLCGLLGTVLGLLGSVLDLVLSTVDDVVAFLPQLGAPGALVEELVDPLLTSAGSLAGNTLALGLNVALDANVAVFSDTTAAKLTDLYVVRGPCAGLSVAAVLSIANQLLGGEVPLPLLGRAPLTIAANVDVCVASINRNFLAGLVADAYVALPGLNLQAIVDVCLGLPAISADLNLVVRGVGIRAPFAVSLNAATAAATAAAGTAAFNCRAWKMGTYNLPVNSPVPISGLVLPLPSVVGGLLEEVVSTVGHLLSVVLDDTLCLLNYLLNNIPFNARVVDVQAAIILLLHPELTVQALLRLGIPCNPQLVLAILADVRLNGVGFIPAPGQVVGVVANVDIAGIHARVLLELNLPAVGIDVTSDLCIAL